MTNANQKLGQNAIVIGASMGGLVAARVLADYYEQVTLIERDTIPPAGENRKGVPQGRHTHGLLGRGREILETLFPGLTAELTEQGAVPFDASADVIWFLKDGYHCAAHSGLFGIGLTRPRLEAYVRSRLLALPNVQLRENTDVMELITNEDRSRVTGIRLARRASDPRASVLNADLVVDVGGRGSRTPKWLAALGYQKPEEEQLRVDVTYTTRVYRREPHHLRGAKVSLVGPSLTNKRLGVILAQEDQRWIITLAGYFGESAPTDDKGFLEFAGQLTPPEIYDVIKNAEPLSDYEQYKFPSSLRRRYERLPRFPEGLLVFGDAFCSFNPIYGQGMTVAALEALVLQECLAHGTEQLGHRFFQGIGKVVDNVWSLIMDDLNFPEAQGKRGLPFRLISWYMNKLHIAARYDAKVALAFVNVANLMTAPSSVMHPRVLWRVLLGNLRPAPVSSDQDASAAPGRTMYYETR